MRKRCVRRIEAGCAYGEARFSNDLGIAAILRHHGLLEAGRSLW